MIAKYRTRLIDLPTIILGGTFLKKQNIIEVQENHLEDRTSVENTNTANRMGSMPMGKLLATMAWPAILSMTIGALYNIIDSVFVAMINADALTAVSIVMPVQTLIIAVGVGSGVGVNSLIARRLGAHRYKEADKAASSSVKIGLFNYLLFLITGLFFSRPFMAYYTDNQDILNYGTTYMQIICCFSVFFLMQLALEKVMQATGNMVGPMVMSISGAIVNLVMDPILIFGLFGAPKLGVAGAAIATVMGQALAMFIAIYIIVKKDHVVNIKWFGEKLDWKIIREIYNVGLPSIIMQALFSFMMLGYNWILSSSAAAVAVLGIYAKLQTLVFMPVFGLNQGALPIMGYNYGARLKKRLMDSYYLSLAVATFIMLLGTILFCICPKQLLALFNANEEMYTIGIPAMRILSLSFIPAAIGIITSTFFQATGHGVYSLISSMLRQCVVVLPMAYFLLKSLGLTASWASFPVAEIIGLIYIVIMMKYVYKKEIKNL